MKVKLIQTGLLTILLLTGCSTVDEKSTSEDLEAENKQEDETEFTEEVEEDYKEDEEMIIALFEKQISAIIEADQNTYMSTISLDKESEEATIAQFDHIQEQGVTVEIQEREVTVHSKSTADLFVRQKMYTIEDNPDFMDRILEVNHHLEKMDGEWKMTGSTAVGITFLEDS